MNTGDTDSEASTLAYSTFQSVWAQFYLWENVFCLDAIRSLTSTYDAVEVESTSTIGSGGTSSSRSLPRDTVVRTSYTDDSSPISNSVDIDVIDVYSFDPHPDYESVTPTFKNIFQGDDSDCMTFIPFTEDPTFDHVDYTHYYKKEGFSWQVKFHDPDGEYLRTSVFWRYRIDWTELTVELLVTETILRLINQHSVSIEGVTKAKLIPHSLVTSTSISSLMHRIRKRYELSSVVSSESQYFNPVTYPQRAC